MRQEIFRMERVTYMEKEVVMLEDFNLQIYQGEIVGMVPINSHGLSAFLKLLGTNLPIYDGYVYYNAELVNSWKEPRKPHNRISVIEAKSSLVDGMTVTDNIFVMRQGFRQELIRTGLLNRQLMPFLEDIGIDIAVNVPVEELPVFERVIVELLRAVILGNRLIVLNEIGALIGDDEIRKLHGILRHYAGKGFSFLYICSHLEEIAEVCGRAVRMTNGRIQKMIAGEEMAEEIMRICPDEYRNMVQYHLEHSVRQKKKEVILQWEGHFSFTVYKGECLALRIAENESFRILAETLTGKRSGKGTAVTVNGKPYTLFQDNQVAVVQELPTRTMIFPGLSYMENLCISLTQRMPDLWRKRKIRRNIRQEYADVLGGDVFFEAVEELSEKQKYQLIYTRVLLQKPRVAFCIHPFKGADVAHRMYIWSMLEMLLEQGIAVVIVSVSLSDSLALADRLLVVEDGAEKEIPREKFKTIPERVPWTHLYNKNGKNKHIGMEWKT